MSFPDTIVSAVIALGSVDAELRARSIERIASAYYGAVYAHVRFRWSQAPEDAADLTQTFFEAVATKHLFATYQQQKGRFRSFVRGCVDHVVQSELKARSRLKRGGGGRSLPIDTDAIDAGIAASSGFSGSSEDAFDREWRRGLLGCAVDALRSQLVASGKARNFDIFERYDLADPDARPTYAEVACALGTTTVDVTNRLHAARRDFRRVVHTELRARCVSEEDYREEARALGLLGGGDART